MRLLSKIVLSVAVVGMSFSSVAQRVLTLDDCHRLGLESNKNLQVLKEKLAAAEEQRKGVFSQFFPQMSATGAYMWNQKSIQLLSDGAQDRIQAVGNNIAEAVNHLTGNGALDNIGDKIVDALDFDNHNLYVASISLTQPIYMGGKIRNGYRLARLNRDLNELSYSKEQEDLLVEIDQSFARVVSLMYKEDLAKQYVQLLVDLSNDVDAMVEVEMATRADQTKVRVKLNEAQMTLTQVTNGLALSRMVLFQLCGLSLDSNYVLAFDTAMVSYLPYNEINMNAVWDSRHEIRMLNLADSMTAAQVKMATADLLPTVALNTGFLISNPSFYNGIKTDFDANFHIGVIATIPICKPANIYSVRAAKHTHNQTLLQIEDAKEKIELEVNKLNYELDVANKKMIQSQSNLVNAEENLRLANESFKAGLISSTDLMTAQTAWLSAKIDVVDADIDIRLGYRLLRQAMGIY